MKCRRIVRWAAISLSVLLVAFVVIAWLVGGALVAPAHRPVGPPPDGLSAEAVTLISDSGATLTAWFIPADDASATVILLHPIRADRRAMLERAKLLREFGYSTLLVDLQAHGESSGDQITAGFRERNDVVAAVDFARERNPQHRIGVVGWSLGGAAALLASPLGIDALVLESVYPTISDAIHNRISMRLGPLHHVVAPALLIQLQPRLGISPSQLRPVGCISDAGCPVLVAAGEWDRHTTLQETKRLYDAACEPKQLVVFSRAEHTDLMKHDCFKYQQEVVGFLNTHLGVAPVEEQHKD